MDKREYYDYLSAFTDAEKALSTEIKPAMRINTLKISKKEFFEISGVETKSSFYEYGFYAHSEIPLGASWEFFLGYMHTQSLSSMLPALALNPNEHDLILDIAASPGSKTSHLAMIMKNNGAILANDLDWNRASALFSNIARLGVLNTKVCVQDGTKLGITSYFTKALIDAPCTSLSQPEAYKRFTKALSYSISNVQRKLLFSAYDALAEGGELVYSTCTYEKIENEEAIKLLLEKRESAKLIDFGFEFPHENGLSEYGNEFRKTARIYPFHFNSEGFFMAKIGKG